jgi:hypothetical protein
MQKIVANWLRIGHDRIVAVCLATVHRNTVETALLDEYRYQASDIR